MNGARSAHRVTNCASTHSLYAIRTTLNTFYTVRNTLHTFCTNRGTFFTIRNTLYTRTTLIHHHLPHPPCRFFGVWSPLLSGAWQSILLWFFVPSFVFCQRSTNGARSAHRVTKRREHTQLHKLHAIRTTLNTFYTIRTTLHAFCTSRGTLCTVRNTLYTRTTFTTFHTLLVAFFVIGHLF